MFSSFTEPFVVCRSGHLVVAVWNISRLFKTELHLSVLNLISAAFNGTLNASVLINLSHLWSTLVLPCLTVGPAVFRHGVCERRRSDVPYPASGQVQGTPSSVRRFSAFQEIPDYFKRSVLLGEAGCS